METEFFTFMLPPDAWRRKPSPSTYKMTREDAAARYPGAEPILSSREVRKVGDSGVIPAGSRYGQ